MAIKLRVISDQYRELGENRSRVFGVNGGTIGRAPDNDWVLPDPTPDRLRSSLRDRVSRRLVLAQGHQHQRRVRERVGGAGVRRRAARAAGRRPAAPGRLRTDRERGRAHRFPAGRRRGALRRQAPRCRHRRRPRRGQPVLAARSATPPDRCRCATPSGSRCRATDSSPVRRAPAPTAHRRTWPPKSPARPVLRRHRAPRRRRSRTFRSRSPDWALSTRAITRRELADAMARRQSRIAARQQVQPFHQQASTWSDLNSARAGFLPRCRHRARGPLARGAGDAAAGRGPAAARGRGRAQRPGAGTREVRAGHGVRRVRDASRRHQPAAQLLRRGPGAGAAVRVARSRAGRSGGLAARRAAGRQGSRDRDAGGPALGARRRCSPSSRRTTWQTSSSRAGPARLRPGRTRGPATGTTSPSSTGCSRSTRSRACRTPSPRRSRRPTPDARRTAHGPPRSRLRGLDEQTPAVAGIGLPRERRIQRRVRRRAIPRPIEPEAHQRERTRLRHDRRACPSRG